MTQLNGLTDEWPSIDIDPLTVWTVIIVEVIVIDQTDPIIIIEVVNCDWTQWPNWPNCWQYWIVNWWPAQWLKDNELNSGHCYWQTNCEWPNDPMSQAQLLNDPLFIKPRRTVGQYCDPVGRWPSWPMTQARPSEPRPARPRPSESWWLTDPLTQLSESDPARQPAQAHCGQAQTGPVGQWAGQTRRPRRTGNDPDGQTAQWTQDSYYCYYWPSGQLKNDSWQLTQLLLMTQLIDGMTDPRRRPGQWLIDPVDNDQWLTQLVVLTQLYCERTMTHQLLTRTDGRMTVNNWAKQTDPDPTDRQAQLVTDWTVLMTRTVLTQLLVVMKIIV